MSAHGRAVKVAFAKEGANVAVAYLNEHDDVRRTAELVRARAGCVLLPGDLGDRAHYEQTVASAVEQHGGLDIVVNNVATQRPVDDPLEITDEEWTHTFDVNNHSYFRVTKAALRHLDKGASIINTALVNGLRGNGSLISYAATKGAVVVFTYSMAQALARRDIWVNAVAPGPVWTPLIPSTLEPEKVAKFGQRVPLGRPAQRDELAPSYVFLAAEEFSSYYTGEVLTALGGEIAAG